jgi:hypothetical protein
MCEMRIVTIHKYQIKDKNIRCYKALYDELCTPPSKEEKTEKMKKKSNENREIPYKEEEEDTHMLLIG